MRPKELIPILAETYGVPFETAQVYDRSLADNGLRTKSKGRKPLDMTRRDAIHFLLACMSAQVATRAVQDVLFWTAYTWRPLPLLEECLPSGYEEHILIPAKSFAMGDDVIITLVDYLLLLTRWLEKDQTLDPGRVKFEVVPTHGLASVWYLGSRSDLNHRDMFLPGYGKSGTPRSSIYKSSHVYGEALLAIATRTADPYAKVPA